jgi:hypothetical protein
MNLFMICSGCTWDHNFKIQFHPSTEEHSLLVEYLNIFKNTQDILLEYNHLLNFREKLNGEQKMIEEFIQNELYGFIEINSSIYAFIGGSMDFTVRVLFDLEKKTTWIQPIYGNLAWTQLELTDLIRLLEAVIQIFEAINFPQRHLTTK